jgi:hypothetical protein
MIAEGDQQLPVLSRIDIGNCRDVAGSDGAARVRE